MSQENVELVKQLHFAYNAADFEAMLDFCVPGVEVFPDAAVFPEAGPIVGREPFRRWLVGTAEAWAGAHFPVSEATDLGEDRVLIRGEYGGVGVASGVEMVSGLSAVYTLERGRVGKAEFSFD